MVRGKTIGELRWPTTPEFSELAGRWKKNFSTILLDFVWRGYDLLYSQDLSLIHVHQAEEELERSITQYLVAPRIREVMSGDEPFYLEHGFYECETRAPAPAQSPQYDLAFVLRDNPGTAWPLEAKLLETDGRVSLYIKAVKKQFLTCRYSPFSSEAAMLGYLLSGSPAQALTNIGSKGQWTLKDHPHFPNRDHKTSDHDRSVPPGKPYPARFRCHHLILRLA